ncbi:hypothetical protein MY10362_008673 [Beauveria mimosiformis]
MLYPQHDGVSQDYPGLSAKEVLAGSVSVARVRPRTSKGITAFLPPLSSNRRGARVVLPRGTASRSGITQEPRSLRLIGPIRSSTVTPCVATARRDPSSPQDRPFQAFPVPGSVAGAKTAAAVFSAQ